MRVMVLVKATKEAEAENTPLEMEGAAEMFEAMGKYNEELVKAGIMLAGDGLKPSKFGKRIHFSGAKRSVTDGPFTETKELVAGFWVWQVRSMDGGRVGEAVPEPDAGAERPRDPSSLGVRGFRTGDRHASGRAAREDREGPGLSHTRASRALTAERAAA